jgi:SSS family solute:Na+ symporter
VFSQTGFSLGFWNSISSAIFFYFGLVGLITYRFRETRALTFHQFFELRYSKGIRVFASFLNIFSGLFNFGLQPAVGARFFVYFCGLPENFAFDGITLPTFIPIMLILMAVSLNFALSGGQISVMVTDCLEGVISSIFYLVVAFFIVATISVSQMREALLSGSPGASYVDPFDIGKQADFNGWYIILVMLLNIYFYRGNAWLQGFAAAAKSAHEGRMAGVLSTWRVYGSTAMAALVSIGAFTVLHHPDFAPQQVLVEHGLHNLGTSQMAIQMRMPMALGVFLAPGVKGAFCAVLLFGLLAGQGVQLHIFGSTFLQDVVLPLRKKPFEPKAHMKALKVSIFVVAIFVCIFSALFKPVDYLVMIVSLIGAIYLGGIGLVCWGGLYWKKGTTAGAWTALSLGATLGLSFNLIEEFWQQLSPILIRMFGPGAWGEYFTAHADKCPLNGQELSVITAAIAGTGYIVVSLATCRKDFNLEEMLHRGKYRLPSEDILMGIPEKSQSFLHRFLQIDEHFTRGDKWLVIGTFGWTTFMTLVALVVLFWRLFLGRLSRDWWFNYTMITGVWVTLVIGVITTVWFLIGVTRDLINLFHTLETVKRSDSDDGTVRNHHNVGEPEILRHEKSPKDGRKQEGETK